MEFQSSRKQQAHAEVDTFSNREKERIERDKQREEMRQQRKMQKRFEIESSSSYASIHNIAKWMDQYYIDPIIGFILPGGIGDALSSLFTIPFVYVSLCQVKSIPLTLAVIFNTLMDILLGSIPFYIGDIIDVFKKSYIQNMRLIVGFVEDDREIIRKVHNRAVWMAIGIAIVCYLIYVVVHWAILALQWFIGLF